VALAVIREIEENKLVDRSKAMGDLFRKELWKLKEKYPLICDVRGSGLMIGVEFGQYVSSGKKGNQLVPATEKARAFITEAMKQGVVLLPSGPYHNVISITPPFIITEKEIHFSVALFDRILKNI
jgi:4-aminobutyrate aminotransferase-like enzyme